MSKFYFFLFISFLTIPRLSFGLQVINLRCDDQHRPISLDDLKPALSWQITADKNGIRQSAYQIIVASSQRNLDHEVADIWDSKKTFSDQNLYIPFNGKPLLTSQVYYWKVKIWDGIGKPSNWSETAIWRMGLLSSTDWKAKWITASKWFTPPQYRPKGFQLSNKGGWADIDLGRPISFQEFRLIPYDSASFPARFRILGSNEFNFIHSIVLADHSDRDRQISGTTPLDFRITTVSYRFIRLQILPGDEKKNITIRQLLVLSNGKNIALNRFTREYNTDWDHGHAPFLVDGMPSQNDGEICPIDACPSIAAPQFRRTFNLEKKVQSAIVYFAALGMVDVTVNGNKVSDDLLGPPFTDYTKRIMYVAYDVTDILKKGKNAIGAVLGNGLFSTPNFGFGQRQSGNGPPRFLLQMQIKYTDGTKQNICSDQNWKWTRSEITFNDVWDGYSEDKNLAKKGWSLPSYNDQDWFNAKETATLSGNLVAHSGPPNRINGVINPVKIEKDHAFFNTVSVGWPLLKLIGKAGQHITITGSGPGYKMAKLSFILAEDGPVTLSPKFIIQPGPMDIRVEGLVTPLRKEDISIQYINADLEQTGAFTCSNPYLNKLFEVTQHTHRNYVNDFPADPNREKQGWTQDAQNMFHTAAYLNNVKDLYWRWWQDMADSQDEQGYLGSVVPMVNRQVYDWNSPWWSGMIVNLPWEHYLYYGDKRVLAKSYDAMCRYVDFLTKLASAGEGKNWDDYPYFTQNLDTVAASDKMIIWNGAGDWNNPYTAGQHAVPTPMTTMPAWYQFASIVSKTATLLSKSKDALKYATLANEIKDRFNKKYLNTVTGLYGNAANSQTGQILPLAVDMVPKAQQALTYARLLDAVHLHNDHIGTGFTATDFLLTNLASRRESGLANKIVNQQDYPSWNTLIKNDVLQEDWHGGGAQMPSCGGAVGAWLFQSVLGIQPDPKHPGFKHFILSPQPDYPTGLITAAGYYNSPYGRINISWKCIGKKFTADVNIPANTSAQIIIPADNVTSFRESDKLSGSNKNIRNISFAKNLVTCEVLAGHYHFETTYRIQ